MDKGALSMSIKIKNNSGMIDISNDVIATVVGGAATDMYGVVGMASRKQVRDSFNQILGRDSYQKGVVIKQQGDAITVEVSIIVSYGTKISEVSKSVQKQVKYSLQSMLGIEADAVNVIVQGVRVVGE